MLSSQVVMKGATPLRTIQVKSDERFLYLSSRIESGRRIVYGIKPDGEKVLIPESDWNEIEVIE